MRVFGGLVCNGVLEVSGVFGDRVFVLFLCSCCCVLVCFVGLFDACKGVCLRMFCVRIDWLGLVVPVLS